jgi:hypothetical protein
MVLGVTALSSTVRPYYLLELSLPRTVVLALGAESSSQRGNLAFALVPPISLRRSRSGNMLEDFFNPEILRPKLIVASIYITAFELLKSTIVERIRSFYTLGGLDKDDPEYKSKVLTRNRSPGGCMRLLIG